MKRFRTLIAGLLAVGVTFGLFLFMHYLITGGSARPEDQDQLGGIRFGPVDIPDEAQQKRRAKPKKPPPPKEPPPPPKMQVAKMEQQVQQMPNLDMPDLDVPLVGGEGMFLGNFAQVDQTAEGDVIPVVVIRPMFPREALIGGIEGWVKVEFTITEVGTVKDPRVIDAEPSRLFNREAIRAILKWKFKPRVVDGVAVERRATQTIEFNLDEAVS